MTPFDLARPTTIPHRRSERIAAAISIALAASALAQTSLAQPALAQPALAQPALAQSALASSRAAEPPVEPPADTGRASAHAAHTAPARAIDPDAPTPWTVQLEPTLWFVAPSGSLQLPATSGDGPGSVTSSADKVRVSVLDLDGARLRPAGEVHLNAGDLRVSFSGTDFDVSRSAVIADRDFRVGAVNIAAGDAFASTLQFGAYELNVGYLLIDHDFQAAASNPADAVPIVARIYALAGVRLYDVSIDLRRASGPAPTSAGFDDIFIEPLLGGRAEVAFTRTFGIDVQATAGFWPGDAQSSFSFDIATGFFWNPHPNIGVQIGYRQLLFDLEDGENLGKFRYDGRLAGLFTGVAIRF